MNRFVFIIISCCVSFLIIFLPIIFIIHPIIQRHFLLAQESKIVTEIEIMSKKLPNSIRKNKNKVTALQTKLQTEIQIESIEDEIMKYGLKIESVQPRINNEATELHLILTGEWRNLLQFFESLSRQPNAMELMYLSMNKDFMEIIFKNVMRSAKEV